MLRDRTIWVNALPSSARRRCRCPTDDGPRPGAGPWRLPEVKPDLVQVVEGVLRGTGVAPGSVAVGLELTETILPTDDARARNTLRQLHGLGVSLVIDDFGNGYSSLRYV